MAGQPTERDPVSLNGPHSLNTRFAVLHLTTDNGPNDPDNSVGLRGAALFGTISLTLESMREVQLGLAEATLLILNSEGCHFAGNNRLNRRAKAPPKQAGRMVLNAVKLRTGDLTSIGLPRVDSELEMTRETSGETGPSPGIYIVQYTAGGFTIGNRQCGNPDDPSGQLIGKFVEGEWGRLIPRKETGQFGVVVKLLLAKGGLRVTLQDRQFKDYVPGAKIMVQEEAFAMLKNKVAGWAAETALASDGFEKHSGELVLAHASVLVDVQAMTPALIEETSGQRALPKPDAES